MPDGAREASGDELTETFELAEPGKEFQLYSKSSFKRATAR